MAEKRRFSREEIQRCVEIFPERILWQETTENLLDAISAIEEVEEATLIGSHGAIGRVWIKVKDVRKVKTVIMKVEEVCKKVLNCKFSINYPPHFFIYERRLIIDSQ